MIWILIGCVVIIIISLLCICLEGFLPMSGSEPVFKPWKWNHGRIKKYNNCYSYFLDDPIKTRKEKPQPGKYAGINDKLDYGNCNKMIYRIRADNPSVYTIDENRACKKGWYKGFLALDKQNEDYHFYRQDSSGLWSHKPGDGIVRQYDGEFKVIYNPREANRRNSIYNYTRDCGFLCVPKNGFIKSNSA